MTSPYWKQWSREDLNSWQGIDEEDEPYPQEDERDKECSCKNFCFLCLDIDQSDFL